MQLVVLPFAQSHSAERGAPPVSALLRPPSGILLYGPPGTGKSMLAKAIASESEAFFINVDSSITRSKWFGESEKLLSAVFSLAQKLQPSIIFVDEMDSFLRTRSSGESEHSAAIKGLWLQLWDGLNSSSTGGVVVIGDVCAVADNY
jgi:SpoVK/Ycf46/Vps4 family AAA+-type ATPase